MKRWEELPDFMKVDAVRRYYDILQKHRGSILLKRAFDLVASSILIIFFLPLFAVLSIIIKLDSNGAVLFRQSRVTTYGKKFKIFKFRTMIAGADKKGTQVTTKGDTRVTRVGRVLRKYRLDEFPQLVNVLLGEMSFVGTRPEVVKYVNYYTDEMKATLLLPAGITSLSSIKYKDEEKLLESGADADEIYIQQILPEKMIYNLKMLENFNFVEEVKILLYTAIAVIK